MRMFVKPRILNQSKYTMKNKQSRFLFSIFCSFRADIRLAKPIREQTPGNRSDGFRSFLTRPAASSVALPENCQRVLARWIVEGLPVNQNLCASKKVRGNSPRDIIPACDNLYGM
jgi:hypothetical protein